MRTLLIGSVAAIAIAGGAFVAGQATGARQTPATAARPVAMPQAPPAATPKDDDEARLADAQRDAQAAAASAATLAAGNQGGPPATFTKETFSRFAQGKTKAQIRAAFGAPASVYELTDYQGWHYTNLPIYDAAAGTRASVELDFPQGTDFVDVVRY